jgi:hypothetical protein
VDRHGVVIEHAEPGAVIRDRLIKRLRGKDFPVEPILVVDACARIEHCGIRLDRATAAIGSNAEIDEIGRALVLLDITNVHG